MELLPQVFTQQSKDKEKHGTLGLTSDQVPQLHKNQKEYHPLVLTENQEQQVATSSDSSSQISHSGFLAGFLLSAFIQSLVAAVEWAGMCVCVCARKVLWTPAGALNRVQPPTPFLNSHKEEKKKLTLTKTEDRTAFSLSFVVFTLSSVFYCL